MASLSQGAIAQILTDGPQQTYVLQCTGVKKVQNANGQVRYRLMLSDGQHQYVCMLATQLSELPACGQLREGSIVEVTDYLCQFVQTKKVVIVLNCTVRQVECAKIGNPQMYVDGGSAAAPGAPAPSAVGQPPSGGGSYGAPPPQGGFGNPAPATNAGAGPYGGPQASGNPAGAGGGAPPAAAGPTGAAAYGNPPPESKPLGAAGGAGAYGAPPPSGGMGGGGGYGAPPSAGPYQQQPPAGAGSPYGAPGGGKSFGAPAGSPYGAPPGSRYGGQGPVVRDQAPAAIVPVNSLNSYQNRWTIKARVTQKSDIRRYTNARGEGRFFSFDVLDAHGGEIRVVGWNDQCDRFFNRVEVGQVYTVSKASLRAKRGTFNQTRHQYEIHLENGTLLEVAQEDAAIPRIVFCFSPIASLEDTPPGALVDVVGVVESALDWQTITRRDGGETQKRSLSVRDDSGRSVEVTLWGAYALDPGDSLAQALQAGRWPVLALKGARVGDYNGKTLSTVGSSTVLVDPAEVPEAARLRAWFEGGGRQQAAAALSAPRGAGGGRADRRVALAQVAGEGLGAGGQAAWVSCHATVSFVRSENMSYPACTLPFNNKPCNKKLADLAGDGTWYCERCGQNATPDWRYILSLQLADHTGEQWSTAFNETAPLLLGAPAAQLRELAEQGSPWFARAVQRALHREYALRLKIAEDTYNDETKMRVSVVGVQPLDYAAECKATLEMLQRMGQGQPAFGPPAQGRGPTAPPAPQGGKGGGWGYGADAPGWGGQGGGRGQGQGGRGRGGGGYGGCGGGQGQGQGRADAQNCSANVGFAGQGGAGGW